jgi:hypothetical protein
MRPQLRTGADQMRSPRRPEPARGPNQRQSNICSNTGSVTLPTDNRQRAVRPEGLRPAGCAARLGGQQGPNRGARYPVAAPSSPPRWRSPSWSQPSRCHSSSRRGSSPTRWSASHCLTPVRFPCPHPHRRHRQFPATSAAPGEHFCRGVRICPPAPSGSVARQSFVTHEHETSGTASVVRLADGSRILRLEGLDTSDGPDLESWLSDALSSKAGPAGICSTTGTTDDGQYSILGELKGKRQPEQRDPGQRPRGPGRSSRSHPPERRVRWNGRRVMRGDGTSTRKVDTS